MRQLARCRPARRPRRPSPVQRLRARRFPPPARRLSHRRAPTGRERPSLHRLVPAPPFHVKPPPTAPASRGWAARRRPADPAPAPRLLAPSPPPVDLPRRASGPAARAATQDRSTSSATHRQRVQQATGILLAIPGRPRKPSPLLSRPHLFLPQPP